MARTYEAFGTMLEDEMYHDMDQQFFYTGEPYDDGWLLYMPDSGYYNLRARYYDPLTARFVSRDPYAGSLIYPT